MVEADERSGALITARQACDDHGRPVFALPGRVDNALSAGPHKLIRDGAVLVSKLEDILEGLDPLPQNVAEPGLFGADSEERKEERVAAAEVAVNVSERQGLILEHMDSEAVNVDALVERTSLPAHVVLQELTFLTLKGQVRRLDGQTFARRR